MFNCVGPILKNRSPAAGQDSRPSHREGSSRLRQGMTAYFFISGFSDFIERSLHQVVHFVY